MTSQSSANPESGDALASLRIDRSPRTTKRSRKGLKALIVLALLVVGGWFGYRWANQSGILGDQSDWIPEVMQNRVEVRLESVSVQKGRSADAVVVATGYLESRRQAGIGARAAGRIDRIFFEEGDSVTKGAVLAELDHKDLDAALAAAAASVKRAEAAVAEQVILIEQSKVDKDRIERLWKTRSLSKSEHDQARFAHLSAMARKDSMAAELELARAQEEQAIQLKENMFIRAPFDGTVISKDAEVGESILPGGMGGGSGRGSVATIADLAHLEIECDVQEDFISRVTEGQQADIAIDAVQDKKYHGTVRKIIPMGDRARATIKVKVQIDDADELLFPEMAGTVYFLPTEQELEINDEPRVFCPSEAIESGSDGMSYVWVIDSEKRAKKIVVEPGDKRDDVTEVFTGLKGKERVVVNPGELTEGTPVTIAQ